MVRWEKGEENVSDSMPIRKNPETRDVNSRAWKLGIPGKKLLNVHDSALACVEGWSWRLQGGRGKMQCEKRWISSTKRGKG